MMIALVKLTPLGLRDSCELRAVSHSVYMAELLRKGVIAKSSNGTQRTHVIMYI